MDVKQCIKCREHKLAEHFYKNERYKDGLTSWCKACKSEQGKAWRAQNKERVLELGKQYRIAKKDQISAKRRQWRKENAEAETARDLQRRRKNPARHRARSARWAAENRDAVNSKSAVRRARSKKAQPAWLTSHEHGQILLRYKEARVMAALTGVPHEVDHIIPINGDLVCGLHVPWNLRVIPMRENRRKAKKFAGTLANSITML
jgi:hypothetical protein